MKKVLKKQSVLYFMPWLIGCAVVAVVLLGVTLQGMFLRITGPEDISQFDSSSLENGDYVSYDASDVIVAFATLSSSDADETTVMKTYYLLPVGDSYIAVVDKKEQNSEILDKAMEQSYEYYLGDLQELTKLGGLSGTVTSLESDMTSYMVDCIEEYGLPGYVEGEDTAALILPYEIVNQNIGFMSGKLNLLLFLVALVFVIIILILLVPVMIGTFQKQAVALVLAECTTDEAEDDFANADKFEAIRVGKYIWYQNGPFTRTLKTSDIIWGYMMPEPLVVSKYRWPVALYDCEREFSRICFAEKADGIAFLNAIASQGNPFVKGYTPELSKMFKSDFEQFQSYASNMAQTFKETISSGVE